MKYGHPVRIVTGDKDLAQLLEAEDQWWDFARNTRLGPGDVHEKFGVRPDQIADYLALTGDSVDNIPGVPGVGPKTASALLGHFGTLDAIFDRPETPFVADFVGMKNFFLAVIEGHDAIIGNMRLRCTSQDGDFHAVAIRPENIRIRKDPFDGGTENGLEGRLKRILNRGFYADVRVDVDGIPFRAIDTRRHLNRTALAEGDTVHLAIAPEDIHLIRDVHQQRQRL